MTQAASLLSDIMTVGLITVQADDPVLLALSIMREKRISSVLVQEDGITDGILTERDVVRCLRERDDLSKITCRDLRHRPLICMPAQASYLEAYHTMTELGIRHLAVTGEDGQVMGIITEANLMRSLGADFFTSLRDVNGAMERNPPSLGPDETVRRAIEVMDVGKASAILVINPDQTPFGILTERDVVRLSVNGHPPLDSPLRAVCTRPVLTISAKMLLHEAVATMCGSRVRRLVVVDGQERVVGILSQHAVIQGLENRYVDHLKRMIQSQASQLAQGTPGIDHPILLAAIMEQMRGQAVLVADADGQILVCSPQCEHILDLPPSEARGLSLWALLLGWGVEVAGSLRQMLALQQEISFLLSKGISAEAALRSLPDGHGGVAGYVLTARDTSDRAQWEAELAAEKDLSSEIIDSLPGLFYLVDQNGHLVRWNRALAELAPTGQSLKQNALDSLFPANPELTQALAGALNGQQVQVEQRLILADGETRHYLHRIKPVHIAGRLYAAGTGTDISVRIRAEDNLRRLADHLHRANEELERFAEITAHDLQEPARGILVHAQVLERRLGDLMPQDAKAHLTHLGDAARRMRSLVSGLAEHSQLGRRQPNCEMLDMNAILSQALGAIARDLKQHDAQITADTLPQIQGDCLELTSLFRLILENSVKFHAPHRRLTIAITHRTQGEMSQITIQDNGIGFAPEFQDQVFCLFKRLHGHHVYPGAGVGLTIAKRIVERHHGRIWCQSQDDQGTSVSFTLPRIHKPLSH